MNKILFFFLCVFASLSKNISAEENLPFSVECNTMSFLYTENGHVIVKFEAEEILRDKGENITLPKGGKVTYYNEDGSIKFIATAKTASSNKDFSIWQFGGGVSLNADDINLNTNNLTWKKEEEIIETEDKIIINHKGDILNGIGLYAKQDLSFYEIKNVIANINKREL